MTTSKETTKNLAADLQQGDYVPLWKIIEQDEYGIWEPDNKRDLFKTDKLPVIAALVLAVVLPALWYLSYDYIIRLYEILSAWGV